MNRLLVCLALSTLGIIGCKNPEIAQISPGVYILSRQDYGGIFGNPSAMKMDVFREANAFAASQGKVAIPVSTHEVPLAPGRMAQIEYQFRLVDPNHPQAQEGMNTLGPTPTLQKIETKDTTSRPNDVYGELVKLDDLRKRGIITDAEFEAQKKKLLAGN